MNVPCDNTILEQGDGAYLYFEITGPSKNSVEGGMFTLRSADNATLNNGAYFEPYLRSWSIGYENLINAGTLIPCGDDALIMHGLTYDGAHTFTLVGDASAYGYDPQTVFVNSQIVTISNEAWLFGAVPPDISSNAGPLEGTDPTGNATPCFLCSVSALTTIAQSGTSTYSVDGSVFGLSPSGGINTVQWLQVLFGEFDSDCVPGTTLCIFYYPSDPTASYGGPQYYPDNSIAQSNLGPTGYGPYETYNSIDLSPSGIGQPLRRPAGTFGEPLPPSLCQADSHGYCSINTYSAYSGQYECHAPYLPHGFYSQYRGTRFVYAIYRDPKFAEVATLATSYNGACPARVTSSTWTPGNPSVQYGDAALP
ncbi:MAG: hypothetical protein ACREM2_03515 [Vulcanimicrobiaceae bacterium]